MKLNKLFNTIKSLNELRAQLEMTEAEVTCYINDCEVGIFKTTDEFETFINGEYTDEFSSKLLSGDYKKTYNQTLCYEFSIKGVAREFHQKVEFFVDC